MEIMIEEGFPVVFVMEGTFIKEWHQGVYHHTYVLDIGVAGHLFVSVSVEDVHKIELYKPYKLKMRLFGHYKKKPNDVKTLNNIVKVYDLKKITEDKGAN